MLRKAGPADSFRLGAERDTLTALAYALQTGKSTVIRVLIREAPSRLDLLAARRYQKRIAELVGSRVEVPERVIRAAKAAAKVRDAKLRRAVIVHRRQRTGVGEGRTVSTPDSSKS